MSEMTLRLPMNYVEVDRDEMEYVDGGGRITLHFCGSTIARLAVGGASAYAIGLALGGMEASIAAAIIFGTGGTGTLVAAVAVTLISAAIPVMAQSIAGSLTAALVTGYNYTFDDHWYTPTCTINL